MSNSRTAETMKAPQTDSARRRSSFRLQPAQVTQAPDGISHALFLQRTLGNRATTRIMLDRTGPIIQRDTADDFKKSVDAPGHPGAAGAQKFPAVDRGDWQKFYQQAIQGVSGKANLTPQAVAQLASAIADECMSLLTRHGCEIKCAMDLTKDPAQKTQLNVALALSGSWGDSFKSALQSTTGGDFKSPSEPVNRAYAIANQAVLASGDLDQAPWQTYMKCIADQACISSEA